MTNSTESSEWKDDLKLKLEALVDTFVVQGIRQEEIFEVTQAQLQVLRNALARRSRSG